jgi:hypothetical protein
MSPGKWSVIVDGCKSLRTFYPLSFSPADHQIHLLGCFVSQQSKADVTNLFGQ